MIISIGESRSKKFKAFSRATELVEGVGHSHIFVSWKDSLGLRWVAEARGSGVRIVSNVGFKEENEVVNIYQYECDQEAFDETVRYIWQNSPKSYGHLQIAGLAWMRLANWSVRLFGLENRFTNPFRDGEHSQICCEFGLNCATIALKKPKLKNVENFGLIEARKFNENHGERFTRDRIDRINGEHSN